MEVIIGKVIKNLRKAKGISQENLAQMMDVSVQAVSKWETQNSYPDIELIPRIAEFFGVSIDYLFYETEKSESINNNLIPDDDVLRIVQFKGKIMLSKDTYDPEVRIMLEYWKEGHFINNNQGPRVEIWGSADIHGNVSGGAYAGTSVTCGIVSGGVKSGNSVVCGTVSGGVKSGNSVVCGTVSGGVNAGDGIKCGDISGGVNNCAGDIHCQKIKGDVSCNGNIYYDK